MSLLRIASMDDLEPRLRRNIRIDTFTGNASVRDVVWAVTGKEGSAASQLTKAFESKHPYVGDKFVHVRIDKKGQETPVANFATLTDVIFVVSTRCPSAAT